ncbi:MAG: polyprenyl synthetase family protein [Comamonadaceae bacterium]|nr:polyprenyl synthetase family protein [Comamonadaceae bacterium]
MVEFIHTATLLHDDVVDESEPAPRQQDGQCPVRQCRLGAGGRLSLFPRLPDDGRPWTACG